MWTNNVEPERTRMTIWRWALNVRYLRLQTRTQNM